MADKNLVARIILSATDKASDALNRVRLNANGLTRQLAILQNRQRDMSKTQAMARSYRDVAREMNVNNIAIKNQQSKLRQLAAAMAAARQPTREMARQYKALNRDLDALVKRKQKLSQRLGELSARLNKAGFDTKNFAASFSKLKKNLNDSTAAINKQKSALERLSKARASMARARGISQQASAVAMKSGAAASAVGLGVGSAVKAGMSEEDAMLGIVKQVGELKNPDNSLNHDAIRAMRLEVQALSRELPLTTVEIMQMYAAGARMDIPRAELREYVKLAAQAAVAFDAPNVEELAENLGKINKNFKLSAIEGKNLADVINYLDDNAISKGADIIGFMNRVAGTAGMVKISSQNIAALGSTLLTLGAAEESAATAVNAIFTRISSASAIPLARRSLETLRLDAKKIQEGMVTDTQATIMQIVEAVKKIPAAERQGVLRGLVGMEHVKTFAKLVDNTEEWVRQIKLANSEMAKGSMGREFEVRMQAASSKWQVLKNQFFNVSAGAGSALFVSLNGIMDKISSLLTLVQKWQQAHPQANAAIMKTVAVIGLLLAGLSVAAMVVGALIMPLNLLRMGFVAFNIVLRANPIVLVVTAIVAAIAFLIFKWNECKKALINGWNWIDQLFRRNPILNFIFLPIGALRLLINNWDALKNALINGWNWIDRVFRENPILNFIFPVIGAGRFLINNWRQVVQFFVGAWINIRTAVSEGVANMCTAIKNMPLVQSFMQMWEGAKNFLLGLGAKLFEIGTNLVNGLIEGIKARLKVLQEIWQKVASLFDGTMRKTNDIHSPSRLMARLGGYIMQGLVIGVQRGQSALSSAYHKAVELFQQPLQPLAVSDVGALPLGAIFAPDSVGQRKAGGANSNNYHITVNVNVSAGSSVNGERIGQDVAAALRQHFAAQERRARGSLWDKD